MSKPKTQLSKALFSPREAATYLALSESTLARMRSRASTKNGPPYCRLGGSIKYRQADLDAWVEHNLQETDSTADTPKGRGRQESAPE